MAGILHLQSSFAGLSLRSNKLPQLKQKQPFVSNGNAQKLTMKARLTYQVEVRVAEQPTPPPPFLPARSPCPPVPR
jgi:hypothetical protein